VTRSTAYGVSMLISVILSAVILLFLYDYDLFGSVLLAYIHRYFYCCLYLFFTLIDTGARLPPRGTQTWHSWTGS